MCNINITTLQYNNIICSMTFIIYVIYLYMCVCVYIMYNVYTILCELYNNINMQMRSDLYIFSRRKFFR